MAGSPFKTYLHATLHPWPCALFVLPLLVLYELGVWLLSPAESVALRNGADTWIRWSLIRIGLPQAYWPSLVVTLLLLLWCWWRWADRPDGVGGVWAGIALESTVFALGLWALARGMGPWLARTDLDLRIAQPEPRMQQLVSFLGAGIYEEVLFRLLLLSLLQALLRRGEMGEVTAQVVAALGSALLFSAAHHIGSTGDAFSAPLFVFRTLAGLYMAALYQCRGFGVAVGAHASYDVLVGVILPSG